jgi:hypothetical protein
MSFKRRIPEKLFENPNVVSLVNVLDGLYQYEKSLIGTALNTWNPLLCMDKKVLLRYLAELGFPQFPYDIPVQVMQQVILNAEFFTGLKGSKIGVEFFCSVMSLGLVAVNDSDFYSRSSHLLFDSIRQGVIVDSTDDLELFMVTETEDFGDIPILSISIQSKFFDGNYPLEETAIKAFLINNIKEWLPFCPLLDVQNIFTFTPRTDFYYHNLLNPYFV